MKVERDFSLIQLNGPETGTWRGRHCKARTQLRGDARLAARELAREIGAAVEIRASDDEVLELVGDEVAAEVGEAALAG